jgi:hypothetical protein
LQQMLVTLYAVSPQVHALVFTIHHACLQTRKTSRVPEILMHDEVNEWSVR